MKETYSSSSCSSWMRAGIFCWMYFFFLNILIFLSTSRFFSISYYIVRSAGVQNYRWSSSIYLCLECFSEKLLVLESMNYCLLTLRYLASYRRFWRFDWVFLWSFSDGFSIPFGVQWIVFLYRSIEALFWLITLLVSGLFFTSFTYESPSSKPSFSTVSLRILKCSASGLNPPTNFGSLCFIFSNLLNPVYSFLNCDWNGSTLLLST